MIISTLYEFVQLYVVFVQGLRYYRYTMLALFSLIICHCLSVNLHPTMGSTYYVHDIYYVKGLHIVVPRYHVDSSEVNEVHS